MTETMIRERLAALGCVTYELGKAGRYYELDAWAPSGHVWVATDSHALVVSAFNAPHEARKAMMEDLALGLRPCEEPDCEGCEVG